MAKTDLKLTSTNGYGDDITTTISYVNPDAGKNDILNFTQALNALTTNTYKETERVQTINVDLETVPSTPTLSASTTQFSSASFDDFDGHKIAPSSCTFTYDGDGDFFIERAATTKKVGVLVRPNGSVRPCYVVNDPPTFPVTFTVGFTATDNYKACSVDITITA